MKKNFYLLLFTLSIFAVACTKEQLPGVSPYSGQKELVEFVFLKANNPTLDKDYKASFDGQAINIEVPKGIDLTALVPTFELSEKATLMIGDTKVESDKTPVNFSKPLSITVVAQNKSIFKYYPSVLLVGVTQDFEANSKTSYHNYITNNLYIDLSTAIQKTALGVNYYEDAYNARAYGDFDKDGDLDIIGGTSNAYGTNALELEYFRNDVFEFKKDQSVFSNGMPKMLNARKAIVADLDNNGWLDVVFVGSGFDQSPYSGETIKILMNYNGKFAVKDLNINKSYFASVTAGDIDNDGDIDLFVTDNKSISKFLINDGAGNFNEDLAIYPGELWGKAYYSSELYDINKDGYLDLVTGGHEHNNANTIILLGNASGNFITSRMVTIPAISGFGVVVDIDFIDYDKDGKTDVLITRTGDGKLEQGYYKGYYLQLLKNGGDKFEDVTKTVLSNNASNSARWINLVRVHDVDNDGDMDITTDDKLYGLSWINNNGTFLKK
ncbi:FG-GAP repeat domain-containing protein [Pedobacter arcticus]|uniref:FG-GAP repeat domain-containing protein n=1 Tax=Pedobacter arcticus TaxID=752140 RepID=UPI0002D729DE|nr:VCBS repeat-containing protein [Pedobacter arcticus]